MFEVYVYCFMHMSVHVVYVQISRASTRCLTMRTCRRSCITLLWCTWTPQASRTRRLRSPPGEQLLWAPQRGQWTRTPSCPSELHVLSVLCLLCSVSMGPNFIGRQRAKQSTKWRKLSCGMWEHCADPPMFALRILLMVLN